MKDLLELVTFIIVLAAALISIGPNLARLFSNRDRNVRLFLVTLELLIVAAFITAVSLFWSGQFVGGLIAAALFQLLNWLSFLITKRPLSRFEIVAGVASPMAALIVSLVLVLVHLTNAELRDEIDILKEEMVAIRAVMNPSPLEMEDSDTAVEGTSPTSIIEENEPEVIQLP